VRFVAEDRDLELRFVPQDLLHASDTRHSIADNNQFLHKSPIRKKGIPRFAAGGSKDTLPATRNRANLHLSRYHSGDNQRKISPMNSERERS
jgi:hypothetical protein